MQLKEHVGLVLENVRLDRFVDEIHAAGFVSLEYALLLARSRRHENDGDVPSPLAAAHQLCQLESVHFGHLHVEKREREFVREQ